MRGMLAAVARRPVFLPNRRRTIAHELFIGFRVEDERR